MPVTLIVAVALAFILLAGVLVRKRRGGRGDLLAPPPGLGARGRPAPPPQAAPATGAASDRDCRPGAPDGAAPVHGLPDALAAEARALLAEGRKIEAVKLVRAAAGCSLEEAVDRVERL